MDLALAIWIINPEAEYLLDKSVPPNQKILEWRGPGPQPTQAELEAAWQQWLNEHTGIPDVDTWLNEAGIDLEGV